MPDLPCTVKKAHSLASTPHNGSSATSTVCVPLSAMCIMVTCRVCGAGQGHMGDQPMVLVKVKGAAAQAGMAGVSTDAMCTASSAHVLVGRGDTGEHCKGVWVHHTKHHRKVLR